MKHVRHEIKMVLFLGNWQYIRGATILAAQYPDSHAYQQPILSQL